MIFPLRTNRRYAGFDCLFSALDGIDVGMNVKHARHQVVVFGVDHLVIVWDSDVACRDALN
jgi:hypothetical protein